MNIKTTIIDDISDVMFEDVIIYRDQRDIATGYQNGIKVETQHGAMIKFTDCVVVRFSIEG